ncbi:hypothetical protein HDU98_005459, partial [Podochytrium sp. JEL0797]
IIESLKLDKQILEEQVEILTESVTSLEQTVATQKGQLKTVQSIMDVMEYYKFTNVLDFGRSNFRDLPGRVSKRARSSTGEATYSIVPNSLIRVIRKNSSEKKEFFIVAKDLQKFNKHKQGPEAAKCVVSPQLLTFYNAQFKEDEQLELGCSAYKVGQWMVDYVTENLPPNYFQDLLKRLK